MPVQPEEKRMYMQAIQIIGAGSAEPARVVTNDDLANIMDTSDDWIFPRTGIHSRRFCAEDETAGTLAHRAAEAAIRDAGIKKEDLDLILVASMSSDYAAPIIAATLQKTLGLREIPALDINAACSGFIYGLEVARGLLMASRKRYALVVGSEQLSRLLSMEDRNTAVLFGDGAGACIVELLPEDAGIENGTKPLYEALLGSRGSDVILAPGCYGTTPVDHMLMDGKEVFLFAVKTIPEVLEALLEKSGLALEDLDYVVCHQANARIIRNVVRKLHAREEQFFMNMETYGNTSGASIPMALAEMKQKNLLKHGAKLALIGFGAGLTYGGALLTVR